MSERTSGDAACPSTIRVVVADDHTIVRKGLCALLATEPDIEVVGEAADGRQAVEQVELVRPDVVLMDLVMPEVDGLEAIRVITERLPEVRILVLTSFAELGNIVPAIKAGALGYLLKDSGPEVLINAIHQVYCGNSSLHPAVARRLLDQVSRPSGKHGLDLLTRREQDVLRLLAQGHSNQDIADLLSISEATVRTHVSHILAKLELSSRTQAALYALRKGLASLEDADVLNRSG